MLKICKQKLDDVDAKYPSLYSRLELGKYAVHTYIIIAANFVILGVTIQHLLKNIQHSRKCFDFLTKWLLAAT